MTKKALFMIVLLGCCGGVFGRIISLILPSPLNYIIIIIGAACIGWFGMSYAVDSGMVDLGGDK